MPSPAVDGAQSATYDAPPSLNGDYASTQTEGLSGLATHTSGSLVIPAATAPVRPSTPTYSLGDLQTEQKNANSAKVDAVSTLDLCRKRAIRRAKKKKKKKKAETGCAD